MGLLRARFDALGDEEGPPLDLGVFAQSFQRRASRNLEEETQKKGSVLANLVMGGRIKALLEERRAESRSLAEHRRGEPAEASASPRRPCRRHREEPK